MAPIRVIFIENVKKECESNTVCVVQVLALELVSSPVAMTMDMVVVRDTLKTAIVTWSVTLFTMTVVRMLLTPA